MSEPITIPSNDSGCLRTDAMLVEKGVADALGPAKMNYEIHGNTIPHLHLFPRTASDVYVGYVIQHRVEFRHSTRDLETLRAAIVDRIREAGRLA